MPIYLDYSATTPMDPAVFEAMRPYFVEKYANPSSIHSLGRAIRDDLEKARETVAKSIGAEAHEIIFTASGSESDNMAIRGTAELFRDKGKHIITSSIEHKAVLESFKLLEKQGFEVTYLPVDTNGIVPLDAVKNAIRKDTTLISIMLVNNEIGTIQPVREISDIAKKQGIIVHTDAVQAMGKMKIDVGELGVDLLTISGHKLCGPKGIGALYIDENLKNDFKPLVVGGAQEYGLRAGTESVPNIIGLAESCAIIMKNLEKEKAHIKSLRDLFEHRLIEELGDVNINGDIEKRVCSISNIAFRYVEAEALMIYAEDICCSTGSACSSESVDASHVLYAIGVNPVDLHGAIRFSFGRFNTEEEVNRAVDILKESVEKLRAMSPLVNR
ncbi:Cysteine desulfurase [Denitrovibrio acetiphilus DSM 12809]|uniref:cysteine desulfurase n=1 Tax=Denitrovibrio acetiphilus (strain DSM 12809 / NBRC 114555 / N2460) TaxID=522772 RepID=D4H3R0_DENA2|nr:cysteine desulfurase family protein [Denitrovibrio acetiphilus]ADD69162.1 Cysteine desulfurase [Denitrovibrio acetiphilus DSM 12809]